MSKEQKQSFFELQTQSIANKFIEDEKNGLVKYTCKAVVERHIMREAEAVTMLAASKGWYYTRGKSDPYGNSYNAIVKRVHEIVHKNWESQYANV